MIKDTFSIGYGTFMSTNKRVIYANIDGHGTANRGSAALYKVYRDLGNAEIQDQIAVTQ